MLKHASPQRCPSLARDSYSERGVDCDSLVVPAEFARAEQQAGYQVGTWSGVSTASVRRGLSFTHRRGAEDTMSLRSVRSEGRLTHTSSVPHHPSSASMTDVAVRSEGQLIHASSLSANHHNLAALGIETQSKEKLSLVQNGEAFRNGERHTKDNKPSLGQNIVDNYPQKNPGDIGSLKFSQKNQDDETKYPQKANSDTGILKCSPKDQEALKNIKNLQSSDLDSLKNLLRLPGVRGHARLVSAAGLVLSPDSFSLNSADSFFTAYSGRTSSRSWTSNTSSNSSNTNASSGSHSSTSEPASTTIRVFAKCLRSDIEYKTVSVSSRASCREVVALLLSKYRMKHRDPNLFYLTMEVTVRRCSGSPVKSVLVLEEGARPAQLALCRTPGDSRFALQMRRGGVVKVHDTVLMAGSQYKSLLVSDRTTAEEVVQLLLNCYSRRDNRHYYAIHEVRRSPEFKDRMIQPDERLLNVKARWPQDREAEFVFVLRRNMSQALSLRKLSLRTGENIQRECDPLTPCTEHPLAPHQPAPNHSAPHQVVSGHSAPLHSAPTNHVLANSASANYVPQNPSTSYIPPNPTSANHVPAHPASTSFVPTNPTSTNHVMANPVSTAHHVLTNHVATNHMPNNPHSSNPVPPQNALNRNTLPHSGSTQQNHHTALHPPLANGFSQPVHNVNTPAHHGAPQQFLNHPTMSQPIPYHSAPPYPTLPQSILVNSVSSQSVLRYPVPSQNQPSNPAISYSSSTHPGLSYPAPPHSTQYRPGPPQPHITDSGTNQLVPAHSTSYCPSASQSTSHCPTTSQSTPYCLTTTQSTSYSSTATQPTLQQNSQVIPLSSHPVPPYPAAPPYPGTSHTNMSKHRTAMPPSGPPYSASSSVSSASSLPYQGITSGSYPQQSGTQQPYASSVHSSVPPPRPPPPQLMEEAVIDCTDVMPRMTTLSRNNTVADMKNHAYCSSNGEVESSNSSSTENKTNNQPINASTSTADLNGAGNFVYCRSTTEGRKPIDFAHILAKIRGTDDELQCSSTFNYKATSVSSYCPPAKPVETSHICSSSTDTRTSAATTCPLVTEATTSSHTYQTSSSTVKTSATSMEIRSSTTIAEVHNPFNAEASSYTTKFQSSSNTNPPNLPDSHCPDTADVFPSKTLASVPLNPLESSLNPFDPVLDPLDPSFNSLAATNTKDSATNTETKTWSNTSTQTMVSKQMAKLAQDKQKTGTGASFMEKMQTNVTSSQDLKTETSEDQATVSSTQELQSTNLLSHDLKAVTKSIQDIKAGVLQELKAGISRGTMAPPMTSKAETESHKSLLSTSVIPKYSTLMPTISPPALSTVSKPPTGISRGTMTGKTGSESQKSILSTPILPKYSTLMPTTSTPALPMVSKPQPARNAATQSTSALHTPACGTGSSSHTCKHNNQHCFYI